MNHIGVITLERVETLNLGAVLFASLIVLWLVYALPRTAQRRDVMGRARATERVEVSTAARDLSAAVRSRRSREVTAHMSDDRLLLRPADPTRRPRFDDAPGRRIDHDLERHRSRRLLRWILAGLLLASVGLAAAAVMSQVPWWAPVIGVAVLAAYVAGLRRNELERRARVRRAAEHARIEAAEAAERERVDAERADALLAQRAAAEPAAEPVRREELAPAATAARASTAARPGEWVPRPVPLPSYALRGEVDDLGSRHAAHRANFARPASPMPLEREDVEALEAADESFAPAADLDLDAVLARRRA